jgi:glutamine amidotransferase-like uncharacterized protein
MRNGNIIKLENVYAVPNTTAGVKVINELLKLNVEVFWLSNEVYLSNTRIKPGTFFINRTPSKILEGLVQKYYVRVYRLPEKFEAECKKVRLPKVALYDGQGVDGMNARFRADAEYALQFLGFPFSLIVEDDIKQGILKDFDVLLIPTGDASEIMHGWNTHFGWNKPPWQLPGSPKGLGEKGVAIIKEFIQGGGGFVGVSSGGAAFACEEVGGIANVKMRKFESKAKTYAYAVGHTRVYLKICDENHPVVYSYDGYYDEHGKWHEKQIPAYYLSDPLTLTYGGPIFEVGNGVKVLATYHDVDSEEWTGLFPNPDPFKRDYPAIIEQKIGEGIVILFGNDPFYGKSWLSTYRLVSNSLYYVTSTDI